MNTETTVIHLAATLQELGWVPPAEARELRARAARADVLQADLDLVLAGAGKLKARADVAEGCYQDLTDFASKAMQHARANGWDGQLPPELGTGVEDRAKQLVEALEAAEAKAPPAVVETVSSLRAALEEQHRQHQEEAAALLARADAASELAAIRGTERDRAAFVAGRRLNVLQEIAERAGLGGLPSSFDTAKEEAALLLSLALVLDKLRQRAEEAQRAAQLAGDKVKALEVECEALRGSAAASREAVEAWRAAAGRNPFAASAPGAGQGVAGPEGVEAGKLVAWCTGCRSMVPAEGHTCLVAGQGSAGPGGGEQGVFCGGQGSGCGVVAQGSGPGDGNGYKGLAGQSPTAPPAPDIQQRVNAAVELAVRYGSIAGAHHRKWVIDQMLRALLGPEGYAAWLKDENTARLAEGDDSWDPGIAP